MGDVANRLIVPPGAEIRSLVILANSVEAAEPSRIRAVVVGLW